MRVVQKQLFQQCPFSSVTTLPGPGTWRNPERENAAQPSYSCSLRTPGLRRGGAVPLTGISYHLHTD